MYTGETLYAHRRSVRLIKWQPNTKHCKYVIKIKYLSKHSNWQLLGMRLSYTGSQITNKFQTNRNI